MPLTNFTARIIRDLLGDNGVEQVRALEIEATLGGRTSRFQLSAARFNGMNWPLECLAAGAILYPGVTVREHTRAAIQHLSGQPPEYWHLQAHGLARYRWRIRLSACWRAIGAAGPVDSIDVELGGVSDYSLPAPPAGEESWWWSSTRASRCSTLRQTG